MKLYQYYELVEEELVKIGFDKAVNHYQPPAELVSELILKMCIVGLPGGMSPKDSARVISVAFNILAEELFPSSKQ